MNVRDKKYQCKEPNCLNFISYQNFKYGFGRCRSCGAKERYKIPENHPRFGKRDKNSPNYKHGKFSRFIIRKCKQCGKRITTGSKTGRCHACAMKNPETSENMSKAQIGKKHKKITKNKMSLSHGGTGNPYENNYYSGKFSKKLRTIIKERDNYTCQNPKCNCTKEEHYKKYNRDIEVHHIDYDRENCKENNLITLCHKCNIEANFNRDYYYAYYSYLIEILK
jgi:hypothetical protein